MSLGQFFTKNTELQNDVLSLIKNHGTKFEPSAGAGYLCRFLEDNNIKTDVALEIDTSVVSVYDGIINVNFFDYDTKNKFDTIYGNPPYVKTQDIECKNSIKTNFGNSLNLYLYFIEKTLNHLNNNGELIFIIPADFLTSTRASQVRELMFKNGTITDIITYGERKLFDNASPYVITIRFEKDNFSHKTRFNNKVVSETFDDGRLLYNTNTGTLVKDLFDVKVGIVSGNNKVFQNDTFGNVDVMCSNFKRTGKKQRFIFDDSYDTEVMRYLFSHKEELISRKIKKFTELNWTSWGAVRNLTWMRKKGNCIYVNCKTRDEKPFFIEKIGLFDGSLLALYPKTNIPLIEILDKLNDIQNLKDQNFVIGTKIQFTQNGLETLKLQLDKN